MENCELCSTKRREETLRATVFRSRKAEGIGRAAGRGIVRRAGRGFRRKEGASVSGSHLLNLVLFEIYVV